VTGALDELSYLAAEVPLYQNRSVTKRTEDAVLRRLRYPTAITALREGCWDRGRGIRPQFLETLVGARVRFVTRLADGCGAG